MIPAAVGFQCPECVRQGRSSVRQTRTVFGGRVTANPHAVTYALIGINVLAFFGEISSSAFVQRFWQIGGALERTNGFLNALEASGEPSVAKLLLASSQIQNLS